MILPQGGALGSDGQGLVEAPEVGNAGGATREAVTWTSSPQEGRCLCRQDVACVWGRSLGSHTGCVLGGGQLRLKRGAGRRRERWSGQDGRVRAGRGHL